MQNAVIKEKKRYLEYLDSRKVRVSRGRLAVFDMVMNTHGHFTSEEMAKKCFALKPSVSRATVYRSIHELLEAGIIRETAFGDKHHHYEHLYDERKHHHAICVRCHQHTEFPDLDEDKRYHAILEKKGFQIIGHEMHFYGLCQKCRDK